ncbi:MAG: peptidoglycan DD-metalloendopeptidase family protein [Arenimonas sp.]
MRATRLALCLAAAALAAPAPACAQAKPAARALAAHNQAAAQHALAGTRAQIKALSEQQKRLESERDAAAGDLRRIDEVVAEAQRQLHDTQAGIAAQERALVQLEQRRLALDGTLSKQRAELATLLRSADALGRHQELQLLLEQDRIPDLARVLAYHHYFERARVQRIGLLNVQLAELAGVQAQIEQRKAGLLAAQGRQRADAAKLAAQKRERGKVVEALDARYRDRSARLGALGRDEQNTVALLERLRKLMAQLPKVVPPPRLQPHPGQPRVPNPPVRDAAIPMGPMSLPLAGSVLAGYRGTMPDGHQSQGLLIAGSAGAQVHAVRAGRVAYADWLKGYGLLLILDHGNGWMSLYAFNDALLKNTGEEVAAGEVISTVGSSGGQGRPALYFELRHNGQPADPGSWLRR